MWDKLKQTLLTPKLDEDELEERLHQLKEQLPTPVFWLLGKAQSGKTSLIRALTGNSGAAIGDGIRPCTRTAFVYDFPDAQDCFLKFLDTRGLGEVDYDPAEDIAIYREQAHLLIVVIQAMDHAQQTVMDAVREITRERPDWPLIVVQSTLHEGYSDPASEHILPYPYHHGALPDAAPHDLVRSLAKQRELFAGLDARFVAVDFTLPEDAFEPMYYGLDALWNAIEDALPLGLAGMVRETESVRKELKDAYARAAHPHIIGYSLAAGAAGAIPVPLVDLPLVTVIQAKLLQSIASIYQQKLDQRRLGEIGSALGLSFLANLGRRELMKFVPVYGAAVSSLATAATTYALGKTLAAYFDHNRRGTATDSKLFQRLYAEQFEQGKQLLQSYLQASGDKDFK
jgi:uncharacterized protein (DUF697 family)